MCLSTSSAVDTAEQACRCASYIFNRALKHTVQLPHVDAMPFCATTIHVSRSVLFCTTRMQIPQSEGTQWHCARHTGSSHLLRRVDRLALLLFTRCASSKICSTSRHTLSLRVSLAQHFSSRAQTIADQATGPCGQQTPRYHALLRLWDAPCRQGAPAVLAPSFAALQQLDYCWLRHIMPEPGQST